MLMMLRVWGAMVKPSPADAHECWGFWGAMVKPSPADAHDAEGLGVPW